MARVPPADLAQLDSAPSFHSAVSDADDVVLYADMREWDSADRIFASSFWSVRIGFDGGEPRVRSVREHPRGAQLTKGPRGYLGVQIPIDTSSGTHTTLDFWHRASPDEPPIATPTGTLPPSTAEGPDVPDVGCSAPLPDGSFVVIVAEGEWRDGALYQRDLVAWKVGCREPGPLP